MFAEKVIPSNIAHTKDEANDDTHSCEQIGQQASPSVFRKLAHNILPPIMAPILTVLTMLASKVLLGC